ncbi:MAG TPA: aspartate carbamoyltransferase, partial [Candidatus Xenobia bacterium]
KLGARVTLVAPPTLLPAGVEKMGVDKMGVETTYDLDSVLPQADVLYLLRIQKERQDRCLIPSIAEYIRCWGVDARRLAKARRDLLIMHPGPMNVGLEITEEVATSAGSVIEAQVTNGVAVRMAVLHLLLGGRTNAMAA